MTRQRPGRGKNAFLLNALQGVAMNIASLPKKEVDEAERKVSAVLEELEESTDAEVKKINLEDVVDTDPRSGRPAVPQTVDITVEPRARRKWLK
jgi:hypothetical protein